MASANIKIDGVAASNDDLPINTLVSLDNQNTGGELTFNWQIIDQPPGPADVLSATNIQNPTFTPKKEGTYLLRLVVNQSLPTEVSNQKIVGIRQLKTRQRVPAAGESVEDGARGWAGAAGSFQQLVDAARADPMLVVGVTGAVGLTAGNTVRCTGVATIKLGLPGEEKLPSFVLADATMASNVDEPLGLLIAAVDGAGGPYGSGTLVLIRVAGLFLGANGVGSVVGNPIYVSDLGTLSLLPGTNTRQVGSVAAAHATTFDAWFDGGLIGGLGSVSTLTVSYAAGAAAPDQTLLIRAADGGPVIFKANGASTGALLAVQNSTAGTLFVVADNDHVYIAGSAPDAGGNNGVVLDTTIALTSGRAYLDIRNSGTTQWAFSNDGGGIRTLEVKDGTAAQILSAVGDLSVVSSSHVILDSTAADGATALAVRVTAPAGWVNAGARLFSMDVGGPELFAFMASGIPRWSAAANVQTTVGAAGGASAPPATPTKYLKVQDNTGATLVVPAYNP